jgi:multidrug efflux pump subunit AcrA (membrane-fusion protein)
MWKKGMKRTITITGIVIIVSFIFLFVFNKLTTKKSTEGQFAEVMSGEFEIAITTAGEIVPERSLDIKGPEFRGDMDIRRVMIKIQDIVPEGTEVGEGDFVATLDRTEVNNALKDEMDRLKQFQANLEMKLLDSAVQLNSLRDEIKNQKFIVEEAAITLRNSKYESPTVIRQAEITLDKAQRTLEQRQRSYTRRMAQLSTDIYNQNYWNSRVSKRVRDLEEVLAGFTVKAPGPGMVIYKKEWNGSKRKAGSIINPMDRVVATLPDLSSLLSKTFVSEIEVSKVKPGQKVNISIDAFPEKRFTGVVSFVAAIGEKLPNTADKVFEVQIKIDGSDPQLRPSMTTGNKILIKTLDEAVFIPAECVHAGTDSLPFVYTKSGRRQVVILGESNDKNIVIEKGLKPGTMLYLDSPDDPENFRLTGEELIPELKEIERLKKIENRTYGTKVQGTL